jgi:hypothetical protein
MKFKLWRPDQSLPTQEPDEFSKLGRDEVSTLVYKKLNQQLEHVSDLDIWLSHDYTSTRWTDKLNQIEEKIKFVQEWAKANTKGVVRKEYLQWLTYFYQRGVDDARKELKTQATRISQEKFQERLRRDRECLVHIDKFPTPWKENS